MEKYVGKAISFLLILVLLLLTIQAVLTPKWRFDPQNTYIESDTDRYDFFYKLPKNTVDYFTIGASTSFYSVNPTRIYAETGITGYDIGSPGSGIELNYYILKECLKTQQPKAVFIDASRLIRTYKAESDAQLTQALIQMRPSLNKLEAAVACRNENQSVLELLFPLIQFHDRWADLTEGDFSFGYSLGYAQNGAASTFAVEMHTDTLDRPVGDEYTLMDGTLTVKEGTEVIGEKCKLYFEKILTLCQAEKIELIPTHFAALWTTDESKIIEDYLKFFDLELLDLTNPEVGLDWTKDTIDSGSHSNFWGSAKASTYLGNILREKGFEDHRGQSGYELWDKTLENYLQWEQGELRSREIANAYDYLNTLAAAKDEYLIALAVKDEASGAWNDTMEATLHRLGVKSSFYNQIQNSFVAVIDQGKNLFERWDKKEITFNTIFQTSDGEDHTLKVVSSGFPYGSGGHTYFNEGSVQIDGEEQACEMRGLNIVVIDKDSGEVISSVAIDSHELGLTFTEKTLPDEQTEKWTRSTDSYQIVEDGVYNIIPVIGDSYAVGVSDNEADEDLNICLQERNGMAFQAFEFHFIGNGLYTVRAVGSDKYLSIEDMGSTAGSNVVQKTYTGMANQKWFITENENGSYSFTSLHNGCRLDVIDGLVVPGANIQVWEENSLPPQQFYLERINGIEG